MADFIYLDDDADDGADEPVNEGHAGGVEGAAERGYQVWGRRRTPVHDLDDDSDDEVRDPDDVTGGGTRPRREPLESLISPVGAAVSVCRIPSDRRWQSCQGFWTDTAESITLLMASHCARTPTPG